MQPTSTPTWSNVDVGDQASPPNSVGPRMNIAATEPPAMRTDVSPSQRPTPPHHEARASAWRNAAKSAAAPKNPGPDRSSPATTATWLLNTIS